MLDPTRQRFRFQFGLVLRLVGANEYMELSNVTDNVSTDTRVGSNEDRFEQEKDQRWVAVGQNGKSDSAVRMPLSSLSLQMRHFVLGCLLWDSFISADHQRTEPALVRSTRTS